LKTLAIAFSDSPTSPLISSGMDTAIKLASDSVATALASNVLPVPGGPYLREERVAR
jgi:hypothetical protein